MEKLSDLLEKFDERLYRLNVESIPRKKIRRILDPTDLESNGEPVICYEPTREQAIQLAFIVWQVATRDRNAAQVKTRRFETAEERCTKSRNVLKSLLLPYVNGNKSEAIELCKTFLQENKDALQKYIKGWEIIPRPSSVWVDEDTKGIFICENAGKILVGLSPENYVFVYNEK